MSGHPTFTYEEIRSLLNAAMGRTLGEVDAANVFKVALDHPKVTGIAGMVVEQSILGYPPDVRQECDIVVDGTDVEVKTTGVKRDKGGYSAKEPMSITAVSPDTIVEEDFPTSHLWRKLEHMLVVYYLYGADKAVPAIRYADFLLLGYDFYEVPEEDRRVIRNDWEVVRACVIRIRASGEERVRLPHEIRRDMMYLDTAPKDHPRFRLKRSYVDSMAKRRLSPARTTLASFDRYAALDAECAALAERFGGMTIAGIGEELGVPAGAAKNSAEVVIVRMFGGTARKINSIDQFAKAGVVAKTVALTPRGGRTEDMKLFPLDLDEAADPDLAYEDTSFYDFFANHQLLCAVFREDGGGLGGNRFAGFRRLSFDDGFIEGEARRTWEEVRSLVQGEGLRSEPVTDRDGNPVVNRNGEARTRTNLPKSRDHEVFLRGSGRDSSDKRDVRGVMMLAQWVWIRGSTIAAMLDEGGPLRADDRKTARLMTWKLAAGPSQK